MVLPQIILFEGVDRVGKTSTIDDLMDQCEKKNIKAVRYKFPMREHHTFAEIQELLLNPTNPDKFDRLDQLCAENLNDGAKLIYEKQKKEDCDLIFVDRFHLSYYAYSYSRRSCIDKENNLEWFKKKDSERCQMIYDTIPKIEKQFKFSVIYQLTSDPRAVIQRVYKEILSSDRSDIIITYPPYVWRVLDGFKEFFKILYPNHTQILYPDDVLYIINRINPPPPVPPAKFPEYEQLNKTYHKTYNKTLNISRPLYMTLLKPNYDD
nr:hypothetical protein [Abalone asfa-like virus]